MTERPPRPSYGEFRHRVEYDPSHSKQMTRLKAGAILATSEFLEEYIATPGTNLAASYQGGSYHRLFEAVYEGLPDIDTSKDEHEDTSVLSAPSTFRRHVFIETTLDPEGHIAESIDINITDIPYTGASALVSQYQFEVTLGDYIHATIRKNEISLEEGGGEDISEAEMTPFDFRQFTIHMAELSVAQARLVRDHYESREEL